ncbi:MAG: glycogen debranching protein GlgX [Proteobacteria bacterium]|nr:glycogen debranching protein GlgX [Pseudomonadota bacterium]
MNASGRGPGGGALAEAIERGSPSPLGATPTARGVNFALHSSVASGVELCLFEADGAVRGSVALPARSGDIWHGFIPAPLARAGDLYGYRVHGPSDAARGLRCNPAKLLVDPCARAVTGEPRFGPALYDGGERADLDSAALMPRARIVAPAFDWGADRPPGTPWSETVLYELHVKGFTARHPLVPERLRGTYLGLAEPAVVDWLRELGVTAVELMPCQAFLTESFLRERGLVNYWGYNPFAWSAPAPQYALADPVDEFRRMVRALHAAGIEVILDVVFNHTAEGNESGPVLNLKAIDNPAYYRLADDPARYENWTGCGNTIDASHPATRALVLDSLRWWAESMRVDGFRFDLGPVLGRDGPSFGHDAPLFAALRADPVLAYSKLIAEPWDVGPGGYQLGQFPAGWSEWNDRYRDSVRDFWRGTHHALGGLAERIAGSSDIFRHRGRKPSASINFVTAHDGFTLADLVSYNVRHNEANLEGNADGHADNRSWNCGVEGPSDDPAVRALRRRQVRNLLATLLISQGVPMLLAGDEFGRSQAGNNNAYCQDNPLSWVDWSRAAGEPELAAFVRALIALRRRRPELRRETFLKGGRRGGKSRDIHWLRPDGREMREADWNDPRACALGVLLEALDGSGPALLVLINGGEQSVEFHAPAASWSVAVDTAESTDPSAGQRYRRPGRSLLVLERV